MPATDEVSASPGIVRILMIVVNLLTFLLMSIVSWWALNQNTRLAVAELALQDLRTWRETIKPVVDADHELLKQLSIKSHESSVTLEQTVALVRDLKGVLEALASQQIVLREGVYRIEHQLDRDRRKP